MSKKRNNVVNVLDNVEHIDVKREWCCGSPNLVLPRNAKPDDLQQLHCGSILNADASLEKKIYQLYCAGKKNTEQIADMLWLGDKEKTRISWDGQKETTKSIAFASFEKKVSEIVQLIESGIQYN
jgi:hypothetical protein